MSRSRARERGITRMPLELIIFLRSAENILYKPTNVHEFKIDKGPPFANRKIEG